MSIRWLHSTIWDGSINTQKRNFCQELNWVIGQFKWEKDSMLQWKGYVQEVGMNRKILYLDSMVFGRQGTIFRQHYSIRRAGYPTVESAHQLFCYTIHPILRVVEHTITPLLSLPQIWGELKQATSPPYLARTHDGPSWPKNYSWVAARFAWASPPCALSVMLTGCLVLSVHSVYKLQS